MNKIGYVREIRQMGIYCISILILSACVSTGPTVQINPNGQIEITGLPVITCESSIQIKVYRQGFAEPLSTSPLVSNGRIIFPLGTGAAGITVTGISVVVPDNCEPGGFDGTYTFTGGDFSLVSGQTKRLRWNQFSN